MGGFLVSAVIPSGAILYLAGSVVPGGWLECDGSVLDPAVDSSLFFAIGTTFGGDGVTTFNLPDLRGQFIRCFDGPGAVDPSRVFGSNQADEYLSHTHSVIKAAMNSSSSGCGNASVQSGQDNYCGTLNTSAVGGTETRPKNVALLAIIKR